MIAEKMGYEGEELDRVYRNKLTKEDIVNEIEKNKGKQFDPKIADTFLRLIRDKSIDFDLN